MCCLPGFYRQKPPFANRWNSDICFFTQNMVRPSLWRLQAGIGFNDEIRERLGRYRQRARQARHVSDHAKMASRILKTVADGMTDAGQIVLGRD